jgi:hypothetical protein
MAQPPNFVEKFSESNEQFHTIYIPAELQISKRLGTTLALPPQTTCHAKLALTNDWFAQQAEPETSQIHQRKAGENLTTTSRGSSCHPHS